MSNCLLASKKPVKTISGNNKPIGPFVRADSPQKMPAKIHQIIFTLKSFIQQLKKTEYNDAVKKKHKAMSVAALRPSKTYSIEVTKINADKKASFLPKTIFVTYHVNKTQRAAQIADGNLLVKSLIPNNLYEAAISQ